MKSEITALLVPVGQYEVSVKLIMSFENQKGVNASQRCSIENQKDAIAVQSLSKLV